MSKHLKTTAPSKKFLHCLALLCAVSAGTQLAFAQEKEAKPSPLVPNLTVNIKLNSALGEKETEFYSKIAQDLISKLPRELNLGEQETALKDLDDAYKHLNVVTYFPPTDNVETDKLIKHFKVRFVFDDTEGAKTADEAKDIVLPKALQEHKHGQDTIVGLKTPDTHADETSAVPNITPMPDRPSMIEQIVSQNNKVYEPIAPELKPAPPAPTAPTVAVAAPAPTPTPAPAVTKPAPKPKPVAPVTATKKVNKLRLAFETDETNLNVAQRVEVMKFITKLRSQTTQKPDGFVFVVRSYEGPIGVEDNLGESRLRAVTALLRQQDINVSRSRVTEIFVRTNDQQFVEVEPVY